MEEGPTDRSEATLEGPSLRIRLQLAKRARDLALFNLAIDRSFVAATSSNLRVRDVAYDRKAVPRATVMQQKTEQPVKFELSEQTRKTVEVRITKAQLT